MTQTPTVSVNKIICFVVFFAAALVSSLFVFRATHEAKPSVLSQEEGVSFPAGREVKMFTLKTSDDQPFTLKDLQNHWTILFFGFTHCSSVCPVTLEMLNRSYETLAPSMPNLQVVFISLDPTRDDMKRLGDYTHAYNKAFIGASGKEETLRAMQATFGIYSSREEGKEGDYQLLHTPSIMLINPAGKWVALLKNDLTPTVFANAVKKIT